MLDAIALYLVYQSSRVISLRIVTTDLDLLPCASRKGKTNSDLIRNAVLLWNNVVLCAIFKCKRVWFRFLRQYAVFCAVLKSIDDLFFSCEFALRFISQITVWLDDSFFCVDELSFRRRFWPAWARKISIFIHVTWFTSIWRRCTSYHNFMFSCTLRTCTSDFNLITKLSIYMLVIRSNLFDFLMKCINSYFSDANVTSWVWTYFAQMLCALLSVLQISSMNLLYTKMLMSLTKLSTSILIFNVLHFFIRLMLKNRKRINEMKDLCNMSAFILHISLVCLLNLSNVSWFLRKLHAHLTM